LIAQRVLGQQNNDLTNTLERLSTGLKINRGSDGVSGLIASEQLRADKAMLAAGIGNAERADQIVGTAESALGEISDLLIEVQGLVSEVANTSGMTTTEKEANQLQVDQILQAIDNIAQTTSFGATKLLNGSLDFDISTKDATNVSDYRINSAKIAENGSVAVDVIVTASAQHAALFLSTNGALNLTDSSSAFTFEVSGEKGVREFSFSSGTTLADITATVNNFKSVTGVSAVTQGTGIMFKSSEFGAVGTVSLDVSTIGGQSGAIHAVSSINEDVVSTTAANITALATTMGAVSDTGQDVAGVINGNTATGRGRTISIVTEALDIELDLATAGATATGNINALTISGGGAKFNLGPSVDVGNQVRLGLRNVEARNLGDTADGYLSTLRGGQANNLVDGSLEDSQTVIANVITQVGSMRGRLGGFQRYTVQTRINSLNVQLENTSAAESAIRDTDFAAETAKLTRSQIMVQAATSVLAISNARPQSVLQLLG
jgi:flagellin